MLNILEFELGILSSYHRFWRQNKILVSYIYLVFITEKDTK